MTTLAVGIITYKRPESLKRLLAALAAQTFANKEPLPFTIVITDNDSAGSARSVCDEARDLHKLNITYVVEPQNGIPFARNRVVASLPDACDLLAWVDDDESPMPQWLDVLTSTQRETEADIVMGSVEAILPEGTPAWIRMGGFFNRRRFVDRATLSEGAINSSLMKVSSLKAHALGFDEKLRYPGSSDTLFLRQAAQKQLRMVWAAEAVVQDFPPLERCTLKWLMQRNYNGGITLAICDIRLNGIAGWFYRLWCGLLKLFQGLLNLPIGLESRHEMAKSVLMFARGSGMIAGLFGAR